MYKKMSSIISKALKDHDMQYISINKNELTTLINSDYSKAFELYNKGIRFYRGHINGPTDIFVAKSGIRISQDTNNVYTLLMSDILPSWKGFPKRSESIIMTTNSKVADFYARERADTTGEGSTIYSVFPFNDALFSVSLLQSDIWNAFNTTLEKHRIDGLSEFNHSIIDAINSVLLYGEYIKQNKRQKLIDLLDTHEFIYLNAKKYISGWHEDDVVTAFNENNINLVKSYLNSFNEIVRMMTPVDMRLFFDVFEINSLSSYLINGVSNKTGIIEILDDLLNPAIASIKKMKLNDIENIYNSLGKKNDSDAAELWTESPCLFIDVYSHILKP